MGEGDANRTIVMGDNFGRGELPSVVCYICRAPELTTKFFKGQICHNQGCKGCSKIRDKTSTEVGHNSSSKS